MGLLPEEQGASALLLVRIRTPKYSDLRSAWINVLMPHAIRIDLVDAYGNPKTEGQWLQPHKHPLGEHSLADRWGNRLSLPGDVARELWFKLYFTAPGVYPLELKLNDSALYEEFTARGEIEIYEAHQLSVRDQLGRLIDKAETKLRAEGNAFTGGPDTGDLLNGLVHAHKIVPEDLLPLLKEVPSDPKGLSVAAALRSHLRGLYDAQRALP